MTSLHLTPDTLSIGLRALKALALADGTFAERERELLRAAARAFTPIDRLVADPDLLDPITPAEVAALVPDEQTRTRIVQAQIIMALIDGEVSPTEHAIISEFAEALDVDEPRLHNLHQLLQGQHLLLRLDLNRRSLMLQEAVQHARQEGGLRAAWKTAAPFLSKHLAVDSALAARYAALAELPPETFGFLYHAHMRERGFSFPGEPGGFPEEFIKHDCCHTLGGYDTDPVGECEVVAFICGFMRADPFWYLFMILVHMHLGITTFSDTPVGNMAFDAERVISAFRRGQQVPIDLYAPGFDWWPLFPLPIDEVRARFNL